MPEYSYFKDTGNLTNAYSASLYIPERQKNSYCVMFLMNQNKLKMHFNI